jgi:hypothetical protein
MKIMCGCNHEQATPPPAAGASLRTARRFALPALLVVLALGGCAPPGTYSKVRGIVRDVVTRDLGPADKYDVDVSRDSVSNLRAGRLSSVKVHGVNVRTHAGIVLDEVFLSADDVVVDRKAKRVKSARDASFTAYLGDATLASVLARTQSIVNPVVSITPDGVTVRGQYTMAGVPMNVSASGNVRIAGPQSLEFVSKSVTAGGVPVPFPLTRVMDFSKVYEPLVINQLTLQQGRAELKGTLDWSKMP